LECYLTETAASWRANFDPRTVEDLCLLTGLEVSELPDVLQNWARHKRSAYNHLLNRVDPMDYALQDPWSKLKLEVDVFLSKRAYNGLLKKHGKD
jgi:hypothetical protein